MIDLNLMLAEEAIELGTWGWAAIAMVVLGGLAVAAGLFYFFLYTISRTKMKTPHPEQLELKVEEIREDL